MSKLNAAIVRYQYAKLSSRVPMAAGRGDLLLLNIIGFFVRRLPQFTHYIRSVRNDNRVLHRRYTIGTEHS
jgi:hypothetical protein